MRAYVKCATANYHELLSHSSQVKLTNILPISEDVGWPRQLHSSRLHALALHIFGVMAAVAHAGTVLPPNTALMLADVNATTRADDVIWLAKCYAIPDDALYVRLVMGTFVDYFKPVEAQRGARY
jgi:hypothetical protein